MLSVDFFLIESLYLTSNPIGFKIYLFKNIEKIKITSATAITVLIIKSFLSVTALTISLACSDTKIYPISFSPKFILLSVFT